MAGLLIEESRTKYPWTKSSPDKIPPIMDFVPGVSFRRGILSVHLY